MTSKAQRKSNAAAKYREAFSSSLFRIFALSERNLIQLKADGRDFFFFFCIFLLTMCSRLLVDVQVKRLPLAVVRSDGSNSTALESFLETISNFCVIQRPYDRLQTAIASVERGDAWGVLNVGSKFSESEHSCSLGKAMNGSHTNGLTIDIQVDGTDNFTGLGLQRRIINAFNVSFSLVEKSIHVRVRACELDSFFYLLRSDVIYPENSPDI